MVGISTGDSRAHVERFCRDTGATYPVLLDERGDVARAFDIVTSPTCVLVERGGSITYRGARPPEDLR